MRYAHEIVIRRPVSEVFAFMDDVGRESEWQPNLVEATQDPPGATTVGTRKRYVSRFLGKRIRNTYVTTAFEADRRVVYETTPDSVLTGRVEVRFEEVADATRVSMSFEGEVGGPLRFVPKGMLEKAYKAELEATLQRLKASLETL